MQHTFLNGWFELLPGSLSLKRTTQQTEFVRHSADLMVCFWWSVYRLVCKSEWLNDGGKEPLTDDRQAATLKLVMLVYVLSYIR